MWSPGSNTYGRNRWDPAKSRSIPEAVFVTGILIICLHTFFVIDIWFSLFTFFASFLSLSFLSYVFVIHSSWGLHTEQSNKAEASHIWCRDRVFSTYTIEEEEPFFLKYVSRRIYRQVCHNTSINQMLFVSTAYTCIIIQFRRVCIQFVTLVSLEKWH